MKFVFKSNGTSFKKGWQHWEESKADSRQESFNSGFSILNICCYYSCFFIFEFSFCVVGVYTGQKADDFNLCYIMWLTGNLYRWLHYKLHSIHLSVLYLSGTKNSRKPIVHKKLAHT